jgi:hypothetical protein
MSYGPRELIDHIMGIVVTTLSAKMIYLSLFIILWSYLLYILSIFLMLVPYNHQESVIMLSL